MMAEYRLARVLVERRRKLAQDALAARAPGARGRRGAARGRADLAENLINCAELELAEPLCRSLVAAAEARDGGRFATARARGRDAARARALRAGRARRGRAAAARRVRRASAATARRRGALAAARPLAALLLDAGHAHERSRCG